MERRMYNYKTGEITGIESPELREIQKRLRSMRTLIEAEKRLPTDAEMAEIHELDQWLSQPADPVKAAAMRPELSDPVHGPILATGKRNEGYELKGPGESKEFRSLYGSQPLNTYRWKDKEITFYQAAFSGRMHPDLVTRSMWESVGSQGGFLVPIEHSERIHNISLEDEIVQPRSFVQPMKTNAIDIPAMTIGNHSSNLWVISQQVMLRKPEPSVRLLLRSARWSSGPKNSPAVSGSLEN